MRKNIILSLLLSGLLLSGCTIKLPGVSAPEPESLPPVSTAEDVIAPHTFPLPELGVSLVLPGDYTITKNDEYNRRGSFVSYDLYAKKSWPAFYELQFFSRASINEFNTNCAKEDNICFLGDYPTVERFDAFKKSLAAKKSYDTFSYQEFNDRGYLTSSARCDGDSCVVREYTTFVDNTMVTVVIMMNDADEEPEADALFTQFHLNQITKTSNALDPATVAALLPENAENIRLFPGDFNGDHLVDVSVRYDLKNVVIDDMRNRGDKQYLETLIYENNSFVKKRVDEGFPLRSWGLTDPVIVDFNKDGKDEIFVLKVQAGTGAYKSYYVMQYQRGELVDVWIEHPPANDRLGGGKVNMFVENGKLVQRIYAHTEYDPNCCPTGPLITTTWEMRDDRFVFIDRTADYTPDDRKRPVYTDTEYGFSFQHTGFFDINNILKVYDYTKEIEPGPAAFYDTLFKARWQKRLEHQSQYHVGDTCVTADVSPVTDYDMTEVACEVFALEPYYVLQYTDPDSVDYVIVLPDKELVFSFKQKTPLAFMVILNTLTFDK